MGSAASGEGSIFRPKAAMNCSELIRRRTFSWATRSAPVFPRFSLPPVWSPCQCVLTTNRTGAGVTVRIAARILSLRGAYWSSITYAPSFPTDSPMFPPLPVSM